MDLRRRCDASALAGAGVWGLVLLVGTPGAAGSRVAPGTAGSWTATSGLVEAAVLFAALALVPAALPLAATPRRDGSHHRAYRWAVTLQPVGAGLLALSSLVAPGRPALAAPLGADAVGAALALPWVGVTLLLAAFGAWRLLPRGLAPVEEAVLDAGLLYLPVGALAVVAYRLDLGLGYGLAIVHLTAAHYHYATFLLPVVAAAAGRRLAPHGPGYRATAVVLVAGVPLVATGITASPALEAAAATAFAAGVLAVAVAFLGVARRVAGEDRLAAGLLVVAAGAAAGSMALAVAYAWGQWVGPAVVAIPGMVRSHGLANAFGFALPAVLAWRRLAPPSRAPAPGVPFARLRGGLRVGPEYAERRGLAGDVLPGQVDDVARYAGRTFDPDALDPRVRRFYERTAEYRMTYRARWFFPFRLGTRAAMALAGWVEQLALPTDGTVHEMVGRCPALSADDPRQSPRFWIRTDPATGRGVFVATYGVHENDGTAYMNVGMPLPGGSLAAILVPRNVGGGLELSSVPRGDGDRGGTRAAGEHDDVGERGDAGLYLLVPLVGPVRLPASERFRVWPADDPDTPAPPDDGDYELVATHGMWLLGRRFLTVAYGLDRDEEPGPR